MRPLATLRAGVGLSALLCACSSTTTHVETSVLPLRTLRLYETGVGYFERSGDLTVSRGMALPVPAGHLDDALKTLVVLGREGKRTVQGVEFASSVSHGMARALAGLPVSGDERLDLEQLLVGLKGATVEVRAHGVAHRGRLVEVVVASEDGVASAPAKEGTPVVTPGAKDDRARPESLTLILLTEAGAIVRVPAATVDSVRPLDPAWAARIGSALDALSLRGAESERLLRVMSEGTGPVSLGYVAEIPVWRTTYRLVRDGKGGASVLQGWALLHNDTDEDWHGVRVELANGRPDSFLFPLAAPRYARRELVAPDDHLATVPQLMGSTVDALWGDQVGDSAGAGGLALTGTGEGGGGRGEGIGLGSIGTVGHGAGSGTSSLLEVGNLAATAAARGVEAGALFVYTLRDQVSLRAHGSALVPFTQEAVDASPIAWVESPGSPARSGVRFVNSTSQTLPAGTIAFFGDGGFAGESTLTRLKPGERRFLTYGFDLDVELAVHDAHTTDATKRLAWRKSTDTLEEHYLRTSDVTYTIENRSGQARSVLLTTSLGANATLTGADKVEFDETSSHPLALFEVPARKSLERPVHSVEGLERGTRFVSLTAARLGEMAASPSLDAADRAAVTEAEGRLREAEDDAREGLQAKSDVAEVEKDLVRVREEVHAMAGEHAGAPQTNPFVARLVAAEDKLTALRKRERGFESDGKAKSAAAKAALSRLAR
jgi:hypothetical protein